MNKQKTEKKSKTQKFAVKTNSRNTDWIVDPFTLVKSDEHMAKKYSH